MPIRAVPSRRGAARQRQLDLDEKVPTTCQHSNRLVEDPRPWGVAVAQSQEAFVAALAAEGKPSDTVEGELA